MRVFILLSVAALGLTACSDDGERYGATYVERINVEAGAQG